MASAAKKPKCKYWTKCYRKDSTHKATFLHPGEISESDTEVEDDDDGVNLVGKTVVFTGSLSGTTRAQAELVATRYGALPAAAVTKNVTYVIAGDDAGSKADKAKQLGIEILSQSAWEKLLKSARQYNGKRLTRSQSFNYNEDSEEEERKQDREMSKGKKLVKFDGKARTLGGVGKIAATDSVESMDTSEPPKTAKKRANNHNNHAVSDTESDEDERPPPPKKKRSLTRKDSDKAAEKATTSKTKKPRVKCVYWGKCFRKNPAHKKEFCHPGDNDEDTALDEKDESTDPNKLPPAKNPMKDGENVTIEGKHQDFTIKRMGDNYHCHCSNWTNSHRPISKRTCKHLRGYLGDKFEDARCGEEVTAGSEVITRAPRHKQIPQVLLANKWDQKSAVDPTGWWVSEKLDGVRAYWDGKAFYSRLGNEFIPPSWFIKGFPSDMTLDGELFGGRGKFQSTVSIVKNPGSGRWKDIKFHIFDVPSLGKKPFEHRVTTITDYFKKTDSPYVQVLEHQKCRGRDHLKEELKKVEAKGGEGLMIREPRSLYENRRSNTLLKIKTFHDAEARVIGHEKGKGRNAYVCGALQCVMECGLKFKVGSGLSDADRRKPPKVGAIITYRFQEYTNDGVPRFPTFVGIRIDATGPKDAVLPKKPGQK